MNVDQIFERMEIYIDDYIVFPLQEIRKIDENEVSGYELNEYMQWEDYVINREHFRKDYQSDIDFLDKICNHANEIELNNCTFAYKEKEREIALEKKIRSAENRIFTAERADKVCSTNLSK